MDKTQLKSILEALLFCSPEALTLNDLKKALKTIMKKSVPPDDTGGTDENQADQNLQAQELVEGELPVAEASVPPLEDGNEIDAATQIQAMQKELESQISTGEIRQALFEIMDEYRNKPEHGFELAELANGYMFRTKPEMAQVLKGMVNVAKPRLSAPGMETLAIIAYQQPMTRLKVDEIRGVDSGGVIKTLIDRDLVRVVGKSEEPGCPILYGTTPNFLQVFGLASLANLPNLKDLEELEGDTAISNQKPSTSEEGESDDESGIYLEEGGGFDTLEADAESQLLIDELENTMRSVKDLETRIFPKSDNQEPSS